MKQPVDSVLPQPFSIFLEIVPEDEQDPDPTVINEVSRNVVDDLRQDGYEVEPLYTGQKGGLELLFQVVTQALQTVGTAIWAQKDTINIISDLCTIFGVASPVVMHLFRVGKRLPTPENKIQVSITIDGAEIEVTSSDMENDERLVHLAERFLAKHPTAKPTPHSKVKVQGRVPKHQPRRRR